MTNLVGLPSAIGVAPIGQIPGTTTNDNAMAGKVGEYIESIISSPISLSTSIQVNLTSISLTAGDWEVSGTVVFGGSATTVVTDQIIGLSKTTGTLPAAGTTAQSAFVPGATYTPFATNNPNIFVGPTRFSLSTTTPIYMVVFETFSISTATAFGQIRALRIR